MLRHAFRCTHCLTVVFLDTDDSRHFYPWTKVEDHDLGFAFKGLMQCPCDGHFETMGRVDLEKDKEGVVIATELRAPCDSRCTNAFGPKCTCRCNCANHGSKRVVEVDRALYRVKKTDGVVDEKDIAYGQAYVAAFTAYEARLTEIRAEREAARERRGEDFYTLMAAAHKLLRLLSRIKSSRSRTHREKLLREAAEYAAPALTR